MVITRCEIKEITLTAYQLLMYAGRLPSGEYLSRLSQIFSFERALCKAVRAHARARRVDIDSAFSAGVCVYSV